MDRTHITFAVAVLVLCAGPDAWARTWRVAPLGVVEADFHDIQPAVEAASAGDTIQIAAGWYQQLHQIVAPAWTAEAIVAVTKDDLTFIGAGAGQTFLGQPTYYAPAGQMPMVIGSVEAHNVSISDMTILNMYGGIYWWQGNLIVRNCVFQNLAVGVACWVNGGEIEDCQFVLGNNGKSLVCELTDSLDVARCSFVGFGQGFASGASARNINFTDCEFRENRGAMVYDRSSTGTIRNTTITGSTYAGLAVKYNSQVGLNSVHIDGGEFGLMIGTGSVVVGTNVIVEGTSFAAVDVSSEARLTLNNSHILPAAGLAVRTSGYYNTPIILDLSHNYWGTTDTAEIDNLIFDVNDDTSNHYMVQYLPIANGPVPTESTSWGDLKALFR